MAGARDTQETFRRIYRERGWGDGESVSGPGSGQKKVRQILRALPEILSRLAVRTLVDAPCGDGNWIRHLDYDFDEYVGADIVPELIDQLQNDASPGRRYIVADICTDVLPNADATLCRDCLVHLPFALGLSAIRNWKAAGFTYVIATTFPGFVNEDCPTGGWRPLNMSAAPFNFPEPLALIRERPAEKTSRYSARSLGVWRTDALPDF
jgi:SAM-dependent methyltransferase